MDFDAVLTAIETHAIAAGASLSDPITDVCVGLPVPRGRCGRIAWMGEEDPWDFEGRMSLSSTMIGDLVMIRFFWPIASADEAAHRGRVIEMWSIASALGTALRGDLTLGDEVEAINVADAEADDANIGGTLYALLDLPVHISYREQVMAR